MCNILPNVVDFIESDKRLKNLWLPISEFDKAQSNLCHSLSSTQDHQINAFYFAVKSKTLSLWLLLLNRKKANILKDTTKTLKVQVMLFQRSSYPTLQLKEDDLEPVVQCVPVASCPMTGHHWNKPGSVLLAPFSQVVMLTLTSLPPQFLQTKQAQLSALPHGRDAPFPSLNPLQYLRTSKHGTPGVSLPVLSRVYQHQVEETSKRICSWIRKKKETKSPKYFTLELEDLLYLLDMWSIRSDLRLDLLEVIF